MKTLNFITLLFVITLNIQSQKIEQKIVNIEYSKEAKKASKKGLLNNAGFFWNEDKTSLYSLSLFTERKTKEEKLEVQTFDSDGNFKSVEILPYSLATLQKLNIRNFNEETKETRKSLNNLEVVYIKNPVLAGKPNLVKGSLKESYGDLGVFERFKFQKENDVELDEKFWAQVYFTLGDNVIERNNYLIQPAPSKKLARALFNMKKPFMVANNKAYIGGMMAVSGASTFLSGIMDLNTRKWDSKSIIKLPEAFSPEVLNYVKVSPQKLGILFPLKEKFVLLTVNEKGEEMHKTLLSLPKTGGKHGVQSSTALLADNNSIICLATTAKGMTGGKVGLGIAKVENGKENWSKTYTNEDLISKTVLPIKEKLKLKRFKMPYIRSLEKMENGTYLGKIHLIDNIDKVFLLAHFSENGELNAVYPLPSVKAGKGQKLESSLPIRLVKTNDAYYAIVRAEVKGYEKGQYTDVSTVNANTFKIRTTQSFRVDTSQTACYVVKINFDKKTASNVVHPENLVTGEFPGFTGENGNLFLNTSKEIIIVK